MIESYIFDVMPLIEGEEMETLGEDTSNAEKISELEKSLADLEAAEKEKQISSLKQQLESLKTQKNSNKPSVEVEKKQSETPLTQTLNSKTSLFRRELKISGTIGQPYETNKLSFISLIHQINTAEAKGYQESEICEAVIKAISSGMTLRGFLESTPGLTLVTLRKILRSHFKEKNATDLYKSLTTFAQLTNEDPQAFLFCGLELRQKVVFASKAIDPNNPTYTYEMIQKHFLRAIETGLSEEAVRAKLRPFLKRPDIEDEELIAELTPVCAEESERENKLGKQKVKAASVQNRKKDNDNVASFSEQLSVLPLLI